MNKENLKNLKDMSEEERRKFASKGGKASAEKRKLKKERESGAKDLIDLLTSTYIGIEENKDNDLGLLNMYKSACVDNVVTGYDVAMSKVMSLLFTDRVDLQNERIKCARLFYEMQQDKIKQQERREQREISRTVAMKELELKERAIALEERKVKAREELIRMKNRGSIDVIGEDGGSGLNRLLDAMLANEYKDSLEEQPQRSKEIASAPAGTHKP